MNKEFPNLSQRKEVEKQPFQKWYPILDLYRKAPDRKQCMDAMKKGGININGENITPIDFFSTCPHLNDGEIIEAIENYLDVESLESKIELLNQSLEYSKGYLQNYLLLTLPNEVKNLDKIKDVADVLKIFKKTAAHKAGESTGLSPAYCALVKVIAASFEFRKKEMEGLIKESAYLYEEMFKPYEGIQNFHRKRSIRGGYDQTMVFDHRTNNAIDVDSYFRGKNEDSFVTKFINKPEETSREAQKDGIGFKFEVKTAEDIKKLIPFLAEFFERRFGAEDLIFENTSLLDAGGVDEVRKKMEERSIQPLIKNDINPHSNPDYRSFKINGGLIVPVGGDVNGMKIKRKFEIQIVLTNNSNETGFSDHFIYDGKKKLSAVTRLLGSFTEEYLDNISGEASAGSGMSEKKIKDHYKENFLTLVKVVGSTKKRYAFKSVVKRFSKAGIFDEDVKIKKI